MTTKQTFVDALVALYAHSPRGIASAAIKQYFDDHNVPVDGLELFSIFNEFKAQGWVKGAAAMSYENRQIHGAFDVTTFDSTLLDWASSADTLE